MFKKILVPIDMQHPGVAARLLKQADDMAGVFDAQVHVLTVIPGYGMPLVASYFPADAQQRARKKMEAKLKEFVRLKMRGKVTTSVLVGKRAENILKTARRRKPDLLVIGCNKRRMSGDMLLGSCSTKLATLSPCSVMTVKIK